MHSNPTYHNRRRSPALVRETVLWTALVVIGAFGTACDRSRDTPSKAPPPQPPPQSTAAKAQPVQARHPLTTAYGRILAITDRRERANQLALFKRDLGKLGAAGILQFYGTLNVVPHSADYDLALICISVLARLDAAATFKLLEQLPEFNRESMSQAELAGDLLKQDREACIAWMKHRGERRGDELFSLRYGLLGKLAELDPETAVSLLVGKPLGNRMLAAEVLGTIAKTDVSLAAELGRARLGEEAFSELAGTLLAAAANTDAYGCMKLFESLAVSARIANAGQFVNAMWGKQPERALAFLRSQPPGVIASALGYFQFSSIDALLANDWQNAPELMARVPFTAANRALYDAFGGKLLSRSPETAARWLASVPEGPGKAELTAAMFREFGRNHPDSGWDLAIRQPESIRQEAVRGAAAALAETDFHRAMQLASTSPAEQQPDVYREIARASAYLKPENAVTMLEDLKLAQALGVGFRLEMLDATAQTWAKTDLQAARQWVEKLPATDEPNAVQGLMTTWMKSDPIAASAWLSNQPVGPARDAGARVVIGQLKNTDPEMAEQWRKTLPPAVPK